MEQEDLSNVDLFFLGALEWDQLNLNEQRQVRDALNAEEANEEDYF